MRSQIQAPQSVENQLARELRSLEDHDAGARERRFRLTLEGLLDQYGFSPAEAADILFPQGLPAAVPPRRPPIAFRNPHTGEEVRTRSFNHATLRDWRRRHGRLTVQLWQAR